jgi:hypothetical protein
LNGLMMADTSFMTSPPDYAHRLASAREDVKRGGKKWPGERLAGP